MAVYNKFNDFSEQLIRGIHDFDGHTYKIMLTNSAPSAVNTVKANLTEIGAGSGYVAGGAQTTLTVSESGGVTTLQGTQVVFSAAGGTIGPFRYAVLYNDTAGSDNLVAWWDYSDSITLLDTESLTVKFSGSSPGNILTLG